MSSIKCPQCGLVNFTTDSACKRCKHPFTEPAQPEILAGTEDTKPFDGRYLKPSQPSQGNSPINYDLSIAARREGSFIVMREDTVLPDRCVMCNAPAQEQLELKLEWFPKYIYFVGFFIFLIGLILYLIQRRNATIYVGLCRSHLKKRSYGAIIGGSLISIGLLMGGLVAVNEDYILIPFAILLSLAGAFAIVLMRRIVTASKIEEPYVWIKGADGDFLDSLNPVSP